MNAFDELASLTFAAAVCIACIPVALFVDRQERPVRLTVYAALIAAVLVAIVSGSFNAYFAGGFTAVVLYVREQRRRDESTARP